LSKKETLIPHMERDMNQIIECARNNYGTIINESFYEKIQAVFGLIFTLLKLPQYDYEGQLHKVYETYKDVGIFVLEAVMVIREDCDSNFKKSILEIYKNYIVK